MDRQDDAVLVDRVRSGDAAAFAPLFERWYDRVYDVAYGVVRRPELAADVAQDAFVTAWQRLDRLDDVNRFGGWLLRIARNRALDALRREGRSRATDDDTVAALQDRGLPNPVAARGTPQPDAVAETHDDHRLVWAAAAALGARDASLLDLHLRHGLTPGELAEDLGVNGNHAHQLVHRMRRRLGDAVAAYLLWNEGRPSCRSLAASDSPTFDAATADRIRKHARNCATCTRERDRRTDPAKLFAAVPIVTVPLAYRSKAAWALENAGVPMPDELHPPDGIEPTTSSAPKGPSVDKPLSPPPSTGATSAGETSTSESSAGEVATGETSTTDEATSSAPSAVRRIAAVAALAIVATGGVALLLTDDVRAPDAVQVPRDTLSQPTPPTEPATTRTAPTQPPTTAPPASTTTTPPSPPTAAPPAAPPPPPPAPPPPPPEPRTPDDPASGTSATTTTEPAPPPPPPQIVRFALSPRGADCAPPLLPTRAVWATEAATLVELRWADQTVAVDATGSMTLCVVDGGDVILSAANAAGETTSASAQR